MCRLKKQGKSTLRRKCEYDKLIQQNQHGARTEQRGGERVGTLRTVDRERKAWRRGNPKDRQAELTEEEREITEGEQTAEWAARGK